MSRPEPLLVKERTPCTTLGALNLEGVALDTGIAYVRIADDAGIGAGLDEARAAARVLARKLAG